MLFGLILLAINAQHLSERPPRRARCRVVTCIGRHAVEQLVTYTTLWWENRAVRTMVLKNLVRGCGAPAHPHALLLIARPVCARVVQVAHRVRNRKTAMMYALALGFVIFITVGSAAALAAHGVPCCCSHRC
jgi:hypothetical protein